MFVKDQQSLFAKSMTFMNEEKQKAKEIQQRKDLVLLKDLFEQADRDGGGSVSLEEFLHICKREDVRQMFKDLDLPVSRERLAMRLFEVLDANMLGEIEIEEFLIPARNSANLFFGSLTLTHFFSSQFTAAC